MAESKFQRLQSLHAQLKNERSSFISHWRDLADYILPSRPKFTLSERNKGDRRNNKIIDSTATMAANTLRSGFQSGITSPARPWFKLTTHDPDQSEQADVKFWLHVVTQRMLTVFAKSNFYKASSVLYGDLGVFGTPAVFVEEDFERVAHFRDMPIGSYCLATDNKGKVNTLTREFGMTVRQLVHTFGELKPSGQVDFKNISNHVKNLWEQSQYEQWVDVVHVVQPNKNYKPRAVNAKYKKFESVYYESGERRSASNYMSYDSDDMFLRHSGYDNFPVLAPRWQVSGEDVYATSCPGMDALGDIKQLQTQEKRIAQAIDKKVNPPLKGPSLLKQQKVSLLPGDVTYSDERDGQRGLTPIHEVQFNIQEIEGKQQQLRQRINEAFYKNLFMMLNESDRRQITAREIQERHEEKLSALGPVLESLNEDYLDPLIDLVYDYMDRQGQIPEPPKSLRGQELRVEYISVMAQAQKLMGVNTLERFTGFVAQVAQANPEVLDKVDSDQLIDVYGEATSVPPGIVRSDKDVEQIRAQRAQAQQQQQMMEQIQGASQTAKTLSETDTEGNNALTQLTNGGQA